MNEIPPKNNHTWAEIQNDDLTYVQRSKFAELPKRRKSK